MKNRFCRMGMPTAIAAVLTVIATGSLWAQGYPERPITLIVPFAAGGAADTTGRIMAESLSKQLGQNVIVENIPGAGGATGSTRGKNAAPDGYTIGLGHLGTHAAAVAINPKLPHNPKTDFAYLGLVSVTPNIIFVRNDFPAKNLAEFIAYAKEKGPGLKFGHSGIGAASHITCVQFFQLIGVKPTYVAYQGFGQTINDIMSGNLDGSCDLVASVSGQVNGGLTRALVVAADQRSPVIPDVPTSTEAGLPEFKSETWTGLYAPKGTPPEILSKLEGAIATSLADPAVQKRLVDIGARTPTAKEQGAAAMQAIVNADVDRWIVILGKETKKP
ncbi:Bug family tripartite tricarboxylate transporter substrate binding protein [Ancylobacter amanitiformis]|uniref:Tripartite-type tricarboxylate transporter receptor subunit TctC n=1 Tax=Ancylobacter amanitiformis TaxID=217069 RepID=A0ABU0LW86_9HYPH|nr:tripartite tricarboxylate transporter substrate-binding protein [Ancylobacter amanitiformis]MDQ0512927.1 tripartite-type tricarboxylate transporter receptor subunit TctC [Ancylobacter amanitiformis]